MKNIHVLPTDKPSRIYKNYLTNSLGFVEIPFPNGGFISNQNIYITSNEEIKDGDWFYVPSQMFGPEHISNEWFDSLSTINAKKIILTTDQDLIKDGVQAIDDEFLEWFIKNPSCESVEVNESPITNDPKGCKSFYKIIIPKEEPFKHSIRVLTTEEVMEGRSSAYEFINFDKQETLEEAALRLYPIILEDDGWDKNEQYRDEWIEGAKWQSERMYSEEEVLDLLFNYGYDLLDNERPVTGNTTEEWFEQFKKK